MWSCKTTFAGNGPRISWRHDGFRSDAAVPETVATRKPVAVFIGERGSTGRTKEGDRKRMQTYEKLPTNHGADNPPAYWW